MNSHYHIIVAFVSLSVSACTAIPLTQVPYGGSEHLQSPSAFNICFNHGCNRVSQVSLTREEWQRATQPLTESLTGPANERHALALAIARLEQAAGMHAGTANDKGGNLRGFGESGQMDCIDESTNTTTYLKMIEQAGFLQWHEVLGSRTRFGIRAGFPHTTAMILEKNAGTLYAVDSWFHDNGQRPEIVGYRHWKSGWSPDSN